MTAPTPRPQLEFLLLGGVSVRRDPHAAAMQPRQQTKLLLGRLLIEPGRLVTLDAIAGALWGDEDRASRRNGVHHAVSEARRLLGDTRRPPEIIVADGDAYRLAVDDPLWIDAPRFKKLSARGHDLLIGNPRAARTMLAEAREMWRGPFLGDLADQPWAAGHAIELERLLHRVDIDLNEARLALGGHADVEGSVRRLIVERPDDERLRGQLIRALLGAERATEALIAFREAVLDLGAAGPALMRLGDCAARGRLDERALTPGAGSGADAQAAGTIVLCAELDSACLSGGRPGMGTISLLVDAHGGVPLPCGDDRLVATFDGPGSALRAASAIASDSRLRARVALDAGAVIDAGDCLIGPGPGRCRQLVEAAHRGQTLVSRAVRDQLTSAIELLDLGVHEFADLAPGEPLFELPSPRGLTFPVPATLSRTPHNLPVQPTRFVGRAADLATLSPRICAGTLLTLTGTGGCGKTRLALQLAARHAATFADGAWFVELAELEPDADVERVATAIANRLGVRTLRDETLPAAVVRHLSDRRALILIDNCEHVHEACAELVAAMRLRGRQLCVLATSRRRLGIDAETVFAVQPMATEAASPGTLSDAVELLLDRAGWAAPQLGRQADLLVDAQYICRAFEGLPLAIELAAGHVPTRGLAGVAAEVAAMLTGDRPLDAHPSPDQQRPARQRTIEAAIAWSYRLISDHERRMLRRLSVFRGTFAETEALRIVGDGDGARHRAALRNLVECSMVVASSPHEDVPRMRLLEPIRAFARRLLEQEGQLQIASERHAELFLDLAVRTAPGLFGPDEQRGLDRVEANHDNLRAAFEWYADGGRGTEALQLVGALWWLWFSHGHLAEGCARVVRALQVDGGGPSRARVRALRAASHLSWWRGAYGDCHAYNLQLAACAEAIDDDWGRAWALMAYGAVEMFHDPPRALQLFEDSKRRFEDQSCPWEAGYALQVIGAAHWFAGDHKAAGDAYEQAVEIFERLGHRSVLASTRRGAGLMAARCGHPAAGERMCLQALRLSEAIGDRAGTAQALNFVASISRDGGDHTTALRRYADALSLAREVDELWATCWALDGISGVARSFGEPEIATCLLAHSGRLASRAGYRQSPHELRLREEDIAALERALGDEGFERVRAEGALMGVGDAVALALSFAARHL
jgi:predicted ATPase/DNA-binding SARP family transcriptional activator